MSDLFKAVSGLFGNVFSEDMLPLPAKLRGLEDAVRQLGEVSVDWTGDGIDGWLNRFKALIGDTELRDTLLVRTVQIYLPRVAEAFTIVGIVKFAYDDAGAVRSFAIDWDKLTRLVQNPGPAAGDLDYWLGKIQKIADVKLTQVYVSMLLFAPLDLLKLEYKRAGFAALPSPGEPGVSLQELIDLINSPLSIGLPVKPPLALDEFKERANEPGALGRVSLIGPDEPGFNPAQPLDGLGVELQLNQAQDTLAKSVGLGSGWSLRFGTADTGPKTYRLALKGNGVDAAQLSEGEFELRLTKQPPAGSAAMTLGPESGSHLELQSAEFALRFRSGPPLFSVHVRLTRAAFVLTTDFLKQLGGGAGIPDSLRLEADVGFSYLQGEGLQLEAGADGALGLGFAVPLNFRLGSGGLKLTVSHVHVRIELLPKNGSFYLRIRLIYGAAAQLGPVGVQMEGAGVSLGRPEGGKPYAPEPPDGLGLLLDAGPVTGGGFLKRMGDNGYGGAMQVKVMGFGVSAFGIYKQLPSGDPSFVGLLGMRFPFPGVQLSWGFALNGVGGLVGVNRRADTDLLRDRLSSGASGNVLFCNDPIRQASGLLNDLRAFFPEESGVFVVGPTFRVTWLQQLLRFDLGVFIELPGPRKLFIAGSARMLVGASEELSLVDLRLDFIGGVDATRQLIFFRAGLVNSHVLHILDITGDVALMLCYGPSGYFLFSAGGFHPSFNPGPMDVPRLARAGASMSIDIVASAWFKLGMYLAVTSNTLQLGARVEAGLQLGPISAHGWFEFDSLIRFRPFSFEARIAAGFDVEVEGVSLYGVRLEGTMSGPGPIVVHASATVTLLFFEVSADVTLRLGSESGDAVVPIANVAEHLRPELAAPQNLRAEGDDRSVVLRPLPGASGLLRLAPVGALIWEQKRAPIGLDIERLEGADLGRVHRLSLECQFAAADETDLFGVGTYVKLSDAEALNNARFSRQKSGLRIGAGEADLGTTIEYEIVIDLWKLPKRSRVPLLISSMYLNEGLLAMQQGRSRYVPAAAGAPMVATRGEAWTAYDAQAQPAAESSGSVQAFLSARAARGVAVSATDLPVDLKEVI